MGSNVDASHGVVLRGTLWLAVAGFGAALDVALSQTSLKRATNGQSHNVKARGQLNKQYSLLEHTMLIPSIYYSIITLSIILSR